MEELFDDITAGSIHDEDYARNVKLCLQLHSACSNGDFAKTKELIDKDGAVAWFQNPNNGWTALHYAAGVFSTVLRSFSTSCLTQNHTP